MPFTQEQFFEMFRLYNATVFPWQVVLHAVAIVAVMWLGFAAPPRKQTIAGRLIGLLLVVLWSWMGAIYHLGFFATINPAARLFGIVFLLQAAFFFVMLVFRNPPLFPHSNRVRQVLGAALIVVGLVIYPVLNAVLGHEFIESPTFGAPCPTTIFTLGLLILARNVHWSLWIVPIGWSVVGGSAAFLLGVPQDYTLVGAGLCALAALLLFKNGRPIRARTSAG